MVHIDWKSKHNHVPPSAVHGWMTKLRGIFTFDKHLIRKGNREINDASDYREYTRDREERRRRHRREDDRRHGRKSGFFGSVFGSDYGDGHHRRKHSHHPFMHFPHRCRPWYHGDHHRFWGFFTRQRYHKERGRAMRADAERERRRERRRRQRKLRDEGLAIRLGGSSPPRRLRRGEEILVSE